jgi:hypothetical protein
MNSIQVIQLDGHRNGPKRIAQRVAAEQSRVDSFNRHMIYALMPHRTAMWSGIVSH